MKIWNEFGSEHSSALRLIGKFRGIDDAEKAKEFIEGFIEDVVSASNEGEMRTHFSEEIKKVLIESEFHQLSPSELEQFFGERYPRFTQNGDTLTLRTDEGDVTALIKLLLHRRARVEVFSEHDYPSEDETQSEEEG